VEKNCQHKTIAKLFLSALNIDSIKSKIHTKTRLNKNTKYSVLPHCFFSFHFTSSTWYKRQFLSVCSSHLCFSAWACIQKYVASWVQRFRVKISTQGHNIQYLQVCTTKCYESCIEQVHWSIIISKYTSSVIHTQYCIDQYMYIIWQNNTPTHSSYSIA